MLEITEIIIYYYNSINENGFQLDLFKRIFGKKQYYWIDLIWR